jgi:hypothetical protein
MSIRERAAQNPPKRGREVAAAILAALACDNPSCTCTSTLGAGASNTHCPSHNDHNPSLSVSVGEDGKALVYCHAGCEQKEVIAGLRRHGLWPAAGARQGQRPGQSSATGRSMTQYQIRDPDGKLIAIHIRIEEGNKKTFRWERPGAPGAKPGLSSKDLPLYRSERLPRWRDDDWVVLCEGEKAADAISSIGVRALGTVTGAAVTPSDDVLRSVVRFGEICLWPDNDDAGRAHMDRIAARLTALGVGVYILEWPDAPPKGDAADFVAAGGTWEDWLELWKAARAWEPTAAPTPAGAPVAGKECRLIEHTVAQMRQPLYLSDGKAYAAIWPWVERLVPAEVDPRTGAGTTYDPPEPRKEQQLHVVCNDGTLFGLAGVEQERLGFDVLLSESPPEPKLWRTAAVQRFREGDRPDPPGVFARLLKIWDHFLDFTGSVASQAAMCELSACFSLTTWFHPAFTVLGYPWPNGEKGSGKTNWGMVWAMTSYLGEFLLSSTSFAVARDLADYGATLLFDDAEAMNDRQRFDPQKRELLLAGNRRGATIPVNEQVGKHWVKRRVNAYCPRGFTSIGMPHDALYSRSIPIPLMRTLDPSRANRDPAETDRWPCDAAALQDDLWALALWLLPDAAAIWAELDQETELVGREFQRWRAVLAVARLLERHGVPGLEERIRTTIRASQRERAEGETSDRTILTIRALLAMLPDGYEAAPKQPFRFRAQDVAHCIVNQIEAEEGDSDWATVRAVGRVLGRLRLQHGRTPDKQAKPQWTTTPHEVLTMARAYEITPSTGLASAS